MNTQFDYQLHVMHHQRLLAEAEHDRLIHEAPRRPSRIKMLWAATRQRMSSPRDHNRTAIRRPLRETSA